VKAEPPVPPRTDAEEIEAAYTKAAPQLQDPNALPGSGADGAAPPPPGAQFASSIPDAGSSALELPP